MYCSCFHCRCSKRQEIDETQSSFLCRLQLRSEENKQDDDECDSLIHSSVFALWWLSLQGGRERGFHLSLESLSTQREVFPDPVTSWGWVISLSLSLSLPQQHQPVQLVRASAPTDTVQAFLDAEKTCRIPITQEGGNPQHWAELYAQ